MLRRQITLSNIDEIWRLAIPNQISFISINVPSLVKIPWQFLKLSSGNENMGMFRADNSVKIWRNLPICNPKPHLVNISAHTKFGENPLMFTQVIIRKQKYGHVWGRKLCQNLTKIAHYQSQTRSSQYQCTYQVWWKSHWCLFKLSSGNEIWMDGHMYDGRTYDGQVDTRTSNVKHNTLPLSCGGVFCGRV